MPKRFRTGVQSLAINRYQRALRRAKCKAWADFCQRASSGDTFKVLANSLESHNPSLLLLILFLTVYLHLILQLSLKGVPNNFFLVKNQLSLCTPTSLKLLVFF
jgi:hypothetical protein